MVNIKLDKPIEARPIGTHHQLGNLLKAVDGLFFFLTTTTTLSWMLMDSTAANCDGSLSFRDCQRITSFDIMRTRTPDVFVLTIGTENGWLEVFSINVSTQTKHHAESHFLHKQVNDLLLVNSSDNTDEFDLFVGSNTSDIHIYKLFIDDNRVCHCKHYDFLPCGFAINKISLSPDHHYLAAAGDNSTIKIYKREGAHYYYVDGIRAANVSNGIFALEWFVNSNSLAFGTDMSEYQSVRIHENGIILQSYIRIDGPNIAEYANMAHVPGCADTTVCVSRSNHILIVDYRCGTHQLVRLDQIYASLKDNNRIVGLAVTSTHIYIAIAYFGIMKLSIDMKERRTIFSTSIL